MIHSHHNAFLSLEIKAKFNAMQTFVACILMDLYRYKLIIKRVKDNGSCRKQKAEETGKETWAFVYAGRA